jgi:HK97 gp10 family phage protein
VPATVTGFREMAQDFRDAASRLGDEKAARGALHAALSPICEDARARMPKASGKTAAQLAVRDMESPAPGVVRVAIGMPPHKGDSRAFIARMIEYGTRFMRARPWLRPAWDAGRGGVVPAVVSALRQQLGSIFRRAA